MAGHICYQLPRPWTRIIQAAHHLPSHLGLQALRFEPVRDTAAACKNLSHHTVNSKL